MLGGLQARLLWVEQFFFKDWLSWQDAGATMSSLLSSSGSSPGKTSVQCGYWAQTTSHGCILRQVGMEERLASGKLSGVKSSHSKLLQTQCSISYLQVLTTTQQEKHIHFLYLQLMRTHCQPPKPLAPGGKPSILKQRQNKPKTTLFSPRRKIFISFWKE